jgi:ubiquinone/menaquinone biosynthesis C-methylase UbiE
MKTAATIKELKELFLLLNNDGPFQPATSFWRAFEIQCILDTKSPRGQGLDLGCGDGLIASILSKSKVEFNHMIGLDIDEKEIELAKERNIYSQLITASSNDIPIDSSSLDFVFSNSVLEHIQDIHGTLAEVSRILKPNGLFIFTTPSIYFQELLKGPLIFKHLRKKYLEDIDKRCAHLRYWSEEQWKKELDKNKLKICTVKYYLDKYQTQRWEDLSRLTSGLLHAFSGKKSSPIEVQRKLGLRKRSSSIFRKLLNHLFCTLSFFGINDTSDKKGSNILIIAKKDGSA